MLSLRASNWVEISFCLKSYGLEPNQNVWIRIPEHCLTVWGTNKNEKGCLWVFFFMSMIFSDTDNGEREKKTHFNFHYIKYAFFIACL